MYIHRTATVIQTFVCYWLLNKYMKLFVGFVTMIRAQFHLVIKLDRED